MIDRRLVCRTIVFFVALVSLLVCISMGWAGTYYVDAYLTSDCTSGNYSVAGRNCTGSDGNGYNTIQKAVNEATTPGDIVYVRAGTYSEAITMAASGSTDNYITLSGYQSETVTISPGSGNTGISLAGYDWLTITKLTFSGGERGVAWLPGGTSNPSRYIEISNCAFTGIVASSASHGGIVARADEWLIDNCTFTDMSGNTGRHIMIWESRSSAVGQQRAGIYCSGDVIIQDCTFTHGSIEDCIYISGVMDSYIQDCVFSGVTAVSEHADVIQTECTLDMVIRRNIFNGTENFDMDYLTCQEGWHLDNTTIDHNVFLNFEGIMVNHKEGAVVVTNNTFYNGDAFGALSLGDRTRYGANQTVKNNIFSDNPGYNSIAIPTDVDYNCYHNNGTPAQNDDSGSNSIQQDPTFLNTSDLDGSDDIWWTSDDGLIPNNSSVRNGGEGGTYMGAYPCGGPNPPSNLRIID